MITTLFSTNSDLVKRLGSTFEIVLCSLVLFWFTYPDLLLERILSLHEDTLTIIKLGVYGGIVILAASQWRGVVQAVWSDKGIMLLLGLAALSALWSGTFIATLQHAVTISLTSLFGFYLVVRFPLLQQLHLLASVLASLIVLSVLAVILIPEYSIESISIHSGAWRGIQEDKNAFGLLMMISSIVFWVLARSEKQRLINILHWIGLAASIMMLVLSYSRTAMVALVVAAIMQIFMAAGKQWNILVLKKYVLGLILVMGLIGIIVFMNPAYLFSQVLGIEAANFTPITRRGLFTFIGRTVIWSQVIEKIREHPILGYGFNSFWTGATLPPSNDVVLPGRPPHWVGSAHNGYLEFLLDLGIVGGMAFLGQFSVLIWRLARGISRSVLDQWATLAIVGIVIINLMNSALMDNVLTWILYVGIAAMIGIREQTEDEATLVT